MIDFNGLKRMQVDYYNDKREIEWKNAMIGKKKRQKSHDMTIPIFEEMNKSIIANIKLTMLSIHETVNSSKKDDW